MHVHRKRLTRSSDDSETSLNVEENEMHQPVLKSCKSIKSIKSIKSVLFKGERHLSSIMAPHAHSIHLPKHTSIFNLSEWYRDLSLKLHSEPSSERSLVLLQDYPKEYAYLLPLEPIDRLITNSRRQLVFYRRYMFVFRVHTLLEHHLTTDDPFVDEIFRMSANPQASLFLQMYVRYLWEPLLLPRSKKTANPLSSSPSPTAPDPADPPAPSPSRHSSQQQALAPPPLPPPSSPIRHAPSSTLQSPSRKLLSPASPSASPQTPDSPLGRAAEKTAEPALPDDPSPSPAAPPGPGHDPAETSADADDGFMSLTYHEYFDGIFAQLPLVFLCAANRMIQIYSANNSQCYLSFRMDGLYGMQYCLSNMRDLIEQLPRDVALDLFTQLLAVLHSLLLIEDKDDLFLIREKAVVVETLAVLLNVALFSGYFQNLKVEHIFQCISNHTSLPFSSLRDLLNVRMPADALPLSFLQLREKIFRSSLSQLAVVQTEPVELASTLGTIVNFLDLHPAFCLIVQQDELFLPLLEKTAASAACMPGSNILRFLGLRLLFLIRPPAAAAAWVHAHLSDPAVRDTDKLIHMWYLLERVFAEEPLMPLPSFLQAVLQLTSPLALTLQCAVIDKLAGTVIALPSGGISDPYLDCLPVLINCILRNKDSQLAATCIDCLTDFVKRGPFFLHHDQVTEFLIGLSDPSNLFFISGLYALGLWLGRLTEMGTPETEIRRVAEVCITGGLAALSRDISSPYRSMTVHCLERVLMYFARLDGPRCSQLFLPIFSNLPLASGAQGNIVARVANERAIEILMLPSNQLLIPGDVEPLIETFLETIIQTNNLVSQRHQSQAKQILDERKSQMINTTAASA